MSHIDVTEFLLVFIVIPGVLLLWFAIYKWLASTNYVPLLPGCGLN